MLKYLRKESMLQKTSNNPQHNALSNLSVTIIDY